ncbi:uncharacterized protein LOC135478303 [Liolophura sinensis]|uniref:uncharacterized protein LOC135478303 n=1 Tax=Liolophura sinensis TaxID=3198878 RepID=UPI0031583028
MKETATRIRKVEELIGLMQKNLECSICLDLLKNPVSTKCDHQFCRFCITEFLHKKSSVPCPLCKKPVTRRSLSERPKLGDIVSGIRRLMTAFHTDQESSANPSQSSQSGLPSSTAVTLQSGSAGCFKRSLEQPNSASIQNDKSLRNLRHSKRRKTEVTHVFIDDLTEPSEAADLVQTHVNVSGGFPASRVHGKKCAKKGNVASRKVKQSNSDGELTSLPNPTEQADDGEGSCEVELVRYLVEASCGAHSSSSNVTTQRLEEEDQDESDGGSVCRGSYEEEESVQSESNCKEFGDCATEDRDDTHDIVHEDVVMLEKGDVSGHAKPENNHDQNPKHGPGEEKHTCSNENTKLNAKQSNDLCDLADSLDYGFMEEKFGTVSQTGSVPGSQPPKVTKPISIGTNVAAKSSVPSGDLEISVPVLDKSKSCRTYATRQKIKKVSNWMYNLPPSVGKNSVNSGCTSEPSVSTGALKKSDLALEGNVESELTTKRPLLARRIFKSRQLCAVKRSTPPREEITDPSAEDDPYVFKSSQRTPKRGKNQKGRKGGKRASRGRVKQRAKDRKPQLCVVQMEKTDASVTSDNQATTPQVVLETQPFEINGNPDEDVLNGEEECESMQIRRQTSDKVSPKAMGEVGGAVSGEVSGVSDSDSAVIPPSVFVPPQRRVLRSSRPQQPLILNTDSCAEGKKMGKQRKNRKLEVEAKKQADQRDMDKLISKISQAESFELLFSSQDVHKQMTAETRKKSQRSTEDRAVQESEASDEGGSSSQDIIKDTLETNAQLESTKGPGDPKTKCSSVPPKKVISYELPSIASRQSASSPKNLTHILPSADVIAPTLSKMGKLLKSVQVKRKTPSTSASPDLLSKRPAVSDFVGETSEDSSVSIISPTGQPGQLAKASTPPTQVSPSNQTGEVYHSSGVYSKVAEDENKPVPSSYNMQKPTNLQDATEAPATSPGLLFCTEDSDSSSTEDLDIHPTSDEYAIPALGNVHTMSTKSVAETSSQWLPAVEEAIVDEDTSTEAQEIPHLSSHPVTDVSTRLEQDTAAVQSGIHQGGIRDDAQGKVDSIQSVSENCVPESPLVLDGDSAPNHPTPTHENSTPVVGTDSVDLGATADKLKTKNDDDFLQTGNVAVAEDSPKEVHYACVGQDGRGTEMEDKRNENRDMDTPVGEATVAIKSQSDDGSARNTQELKSGDNIFDSDVDLRLVSESCGGSLSKSCHEMESLTVVPLSLVEGLDEEPKLKQVSLENKSTGSVVGVQSSTGHSDSSPKNTHQKMSSAVVESSSGFVSVTPGASVEVVHPIRTSFNCARNALSKTTTDETASPKSAEFPVILPLSDDRPLCSMRTKSFRRRSPRVSYENLALFSQSPTQLKSGASNSDTTIPQSLDDCAFQEGSGDKPQSNNSEPLASGVVNENPDWSQNKSLPSDTAKDKDEPADPQATLSPQKEDEGLNDNAVDTCTEETLPPSMDLDDLSGSGIHPSSVTEPQSSVVLVQDSARVIPCSLEPPVSSAQVSVMRPSRKRTRRSAKQEAKNSDSDSELKEEEPLIRRVKRTRSQRNLVNGSGSFLSDSSISQSILTEPKTKAQGKSQTAENPPEPTQICEDTLREQSPESRTSSAKTKGAHLDDSLVLIKNLVKTQALKAKMSKGKVDSPSSSVVGRPCQNTCTASQCPDKVKKFTPAVVCDHEEDFGEGRKGKEDDLRVLRSSAQPRDDDSKCSQRNESQPYETAKVGTRKKNRFTDGQGVKDTCDNLNAATTEGGKQCSPDVVLGSGEIPHLGPGQSPVEEVSEKSEKLRRSGRRRRGKVIKPVIVDTDSDSDSPFELTDAAEIEDQEDLPELEVTKDPKPESSQQAQVCFDREQNEGNDGSKPKKKPVRPVISDDSDDPDDDDDIVKPGDAEG